MGSSNRAASPETIAELGRVAANRTFDEEPLTHLGLADLDLDLVRRRFAGRRVLRNQDLHTLGLVAGAGGHEVPTVGGILLFGRERLQHFPDARVRLVRFQGRTRSNILDRYDADVDLVQAIEDSLGFVARNTTTGMTVAGARRRDLPAYPPVALREAVTNAVVHADWSQKGNPVRVAIFEDRVEIDNPGLLPFGLTIAEARLGVSKLRNRVIGRIFHELGLIEGWGSGIRRMTAACHELGMSEPGLDELGTVFRVTLQAARVHDRRVPAGAGGRILSILRDGASHTTSSLASALGVSSRTVRLHLKRLVDRVQVFEIGTGPNDPHRVYRSSGSDVAD